MSDEQGQGRVYTSVEHYNKLLGFLQTDLDWTFSDKMMVHQALTDYEMEVKRDTDHIDTLTADLAAMTADRDRLREVVEKLPEDLNRNKVMVGDEVWRIQFTDEPEKLIVNGIDDLGRAIVRRFGEYRDFVSFQFYKFREDAEAALAAREQQAGAKGGE